MEWFTAEEAPIVARIEARHRVVQMRKPQLVAEALRLRLGPSRAALDVHTAGVLRKLILDTLRGDGN